MDDTFKADLHQRMDLNSDFALPAIVRLSKVINDPHMNGDEAKRLNELFQEKLRGERSCKVEEVTYTGVQIRARPQTILHLKEKYANDIADIIPLNPLLWRIDKDGSRSR